MRNCSKTAPIQSAWSGKLARFSSRNGVWPAGADSAVPPTRERSAGGFARPSARGREIPPAAATGLIARRARNAEGAARRSGYRSFPAVSPTRGVHRQTQETVGSIRRDRPFRPPAAGDRSPAAQAAGATSVALRSAPLEKVLHAGALAKFPGGFKVVAEAVDTGIVLGAGAHVRVNLRGSMPPGEENASGVCAKAKGLRDGPQKSTVNACAVDGATWAQCWGYRNEVRSVCEGHVEAFIDEIEKSLKERSPLMRIHFLVLGGQPLSNK